jgi:hypothetical protein
MRFLAAGWLTLLIGWIVLAIWLWRRERRVVWVSSRLFWPGLQSTSSRSQERSRPPAWVIAALLALLAIVLALSKPILPSKSPRVTVIIDPHVSMAARWQDKSLARAMADRLAEDLEALGTNADVRVVIPGSVDAPSNSHDIDQVRWTAASTSSMIEQWCLERESEREATVVLSAQELDLPKTAVRYAPESMVVNRAVIRIGASAEPRPQAMVTIAHSTNDDPFDLVLKSKGKTITRRVEPEHGSGSTTVFVDLSSGANEWLEAHLEAADGLDIDNSGYIAQAGGWPRVEIAGEIPRPAERFCAVYAKARPAGKESGSIVVASEVQDRQRAIIFAPTQPFAAPQTVSLDLPWHDLANVSRVQVNGVASTAPNGFEVLSRLGEKPILAVRRAEPMQIWIGCDVEVFAQTAEWVAWMNALVDFLNPRDRPRWEQASVDEIGADWIPVVVDPGVNASPGVYRSGEGRLVAANMPAVKWLIAGADRRELLHQAIERAAMADGFRVSRLLCAISFCLAAIAGLLMAWRSHLDGRNNAT